MPSRKTRTLGPAAAAAIVAGTFAALFAGATIPIGMSRAQGVALRDSVTVPADSVALHGTSAPSLPTGHSASADSVVRSATSPPAPPSGLHLDVDPLRLEGKTSLRLQFRERWPADAFALPLPSEAWERPVTLDAGVPLAGWRTAATDRTPVAGYLLLLGMPNAATAIAAPGASRNDPLLVSRWSEPTTRPVLEGPAELLAAPRPVLWWEEALLDRGARPGPTESALLYEKGDLGLQQVGARFTAPALGPGLAAAYTRRSSDGADALLRATDTRYAAVVALPRRGGLRAWIEGDVATRRIEDAELDASRGRIRAGEALLDDRSLALHAIQRAGVWEHRFRAEAARSRHTGIEIDGTRERWDEPTWTVAEESQWQPAAGWLWMAAARATGRTLRYRAGPANTPAGLLDVEFHGTRTEGRAGLAVRRDVRSGKRLREWGADLAYDAREGDLGFLDARLHASMTASRGSARLDIESTHERATWEDRLLPTRDRPFDDVVVLPKPVRYTVSGDPSLRPRRLNGAVATTAWRTSKSMEFTASGSARYLVDDFGWNLTRSETPDTIIVDDRATLRGSGWVSHASFGTAATLGPIGFRALGWLRGGSSRQSPHAGSLPRAGVDASVHGAAKFFRGDLPLRLGVEAHVVGRREGAIRAAATALFDATLHADFGDAGIYLRVDDLFDRCPPSGLYEIATDAGVPTAGRRLRFGVVWNLLD